MVNRLRYDDFVETARPGRISRIFKMAKQQKRINTIKKILSKRGVK